ncbi:MAG: DUF3140 domain-containing protein [Pseudonocardiaceae bacterium]
MVDTARHESELWHEFHRVVNMSPRELADWLRTHSAGPGAVILPEQAGTPTGQQVLRILGKRQSDLTSDDLQVMRGVIRRVNAERGSHGSARAGRIGWRHRLMSLGHDPLKPV